MAKPAKTQLSVIILLVINAPSHHIPSQYTKNTMKIIDKIHEHLERDAFFYSFEYFPPKNDVGCVNLYERMERMKELNPLYVGITWGTNGRTAKETLEISSTSQNLLGLESLLHITCTNTPLALLSSTLKQVYIYPLSFSNLRYP